MIIGEFETFKTCDNCDEKMYITEYLTDSNATGTGFVKKFEYECEHCDFKHSVKLKMYPEWEIWPT